MNTEEKSRMERITQMESHLNHVSAVLKDFYRSLEKYAEIQTDISSLSAYYGSTEWKQDFAACEKRELPADLKCGVLSEDLIWNQLEENKETADEMRKTAEKIMKNNIKGD